MLKRALFRRALLCLSGPVRVELRDVGPQVVDLLFVLDAGEDHFGARNHALRILDVFLEYFSAPDNSRLLIRVRIVEIRRAAGMPAVQTIEFRTDLVLSAGPDRMTGLANGEDGLALLRVLRQRNLGRCGDNCGRYDER